MDSNCCSAPVSYAAVEEDGTSGLVIEVFDDLFKACADVVLLPACPQRCMPNPVEGLLEVYEDMVRQGCLLSPTLFNIFLERIMTDALEDHEGTVSIGGRTTTNLRFADDIDGLAGEEEELANLVEPTAWRSVPRRPS